MEQTDTKRKPFWVSGLVALTLLTASLSFWGASIRADEGDGPGYQQRDGMGEHKDWKEKLGLSDDQSKKMDAIRDAEKAEMKPLREKMRTLKEKLKWQVDAKASDKEIKATLDELETSFSSMQSAEKKYRDQKKSILTPSQQAQVFLMMSDHSRAGHHTRPRSHMNGMKKGHDESPSEQK
jgi:Spy/CpxP family protein refolding chaperone